MKKLYVFSLVLILLLANFAPVAASRDGRTKDGGDHISLVGWITAIDDNAHTIIIKVTSGPDYKGDDVFVYTTSTTRLRLKTDTGCVPIEFEFLEIGQRVGVTGVFTLLGFEATRITVQMVS